MVGSRTAARVASLGAALVVMVATLVVPAGATTPGHELTHFPLATDGFPYGIALGSDGAMWFTERGTDRVGSIDVNGVTGPWTQLELGADPAAIASGVDDAVWFTEQGVNRIGRLSPGGELTEFAVPTDNAGVASITAGPDGAMWFTERSAHMIGRVAPDGTMSEFPLPSSLPGPMDITLGPDRALWFTEQRGNRIGRITTSGDVTEWPLPIASSHPAGITTGPDGALWFTMRAANRIGRITVGGDITTWPVPTPGSDPTSIAVGWDGALWFTAPDTGRLGRVTVNGEITDFPMPDMGASPFTLAAGDDDAVWFTQGSPSAIGRLGAVPEPPDTKPPTILIDAPVDGSVLVAGVPRAADFSCADDGGSGIANCAGTVADGAAVPATPGAHRFQVSAQDLAGNTSTAATSYVAFSSARGSIASGQASAGRWATLDLGLGARAPKSAADVVAAGFPVSTRVDCADHASSLGAATPADARLSTRSDQLLVRWRTERSWVGTCRAITFRFVAPGWTGADATFVVTVA